VRKRRAANIDFVQTQSISNKKMLEEPDAAKRAEIFDELRRTAADPEAARDFLIRSSMIWSVRRAAEDYLKHHLKFGDGARTPSATHPRSSGSVLSEFRASPSHRSTTSVWPVMKAASALARKLTAPTRSFGRLVALDGAALLGDLSLPAMQPRAAPRSPTA